MSWVERTFEEVEPPDETSSETNVQLEDMLRNLPPYMKIKTRRARKAIARYETRKQKYIENLRQNALYKFVMQVAAFTNEDIQKYWKGKSLTPFIEEFSPEPISISKEDLDLTYQRAKENAYSDLHQFCRRIRAIPMFEWEEISVAAGGGAAAAAMESPQARRKLYVTNSTPEDPRTPLPKINHKRAPKQDATAVQNDAEGAAKYIYNMSDTEFEAFVTTYIDEAYEKKKSRNIREYLLAAKGETVQDFKNPFPAADHRYPDGIYMDESVNDNFKSLDNGAAAAEAAAQAAAQAAAAAGAASKTKDDTNTWADSVPIIRWDDPYAEFWFQRYVARWLVDKNLKESTTLPRFQKKFRAMFNNVVRGRDGVYYRDLTGMSFTFRQKKNNEEDQEEESEIYIGKSLMYGFAGPLYYQRVEWWRHELVLGEYEKRSMVQADQWLQKTPWALGKIYLEPSLYGHMIEAHTAIMTKFKKFSNVKLEDLVRHEKHSYFLSKLVAMCIDRASGDVLWSKNPGTGYQPGESDGTSIQLDSRSNYSSPSPVATKQVVVFFYG